MLTQDDRDAIDGLFERLAEAERRAPDRDAEAEALIRQKFSHQPAAAYYLAQTVVVQHAALEEAERKIADLEAQVGRGGNAVSQRNRGPWDRQPEPQYGGGGFLAGAAQTALGVAGGVLLGSMIGSIFSAGSANAAEAPQDNTDNGNDAGDNGGADGLDGADAGGFDGGGFDGGGFDMGGDF
jgi:hypothetical protein